MGCFNARCFVTNLPITYNDDVVAFLCYRTNLNPDNWGCHPIPLFGKYNDYGGIEDIQNSSKIFGLINSITNSNDITGFDIMDEASLNECIHNILGKYYHSTSYNRYYKFAMIHRSVYDKLSNVCYDYDGNNVLNEAYVIFKGVIEKYNDIITKSADAPDETLYNSFLDVFNEKKKTSYFHDGAFRDALRDYTINGKEIPSNLHFGFLSALSYRDESIHSFVHPFGLYRHGFLSFDEFFKLTMFFTSLRSLDISPQPFSCGQGRVSIYHDFMVKISSEIVTEKLNDGL